MGGYWRTSSPIHFDKMPKLHQGQAKRLHFQNDWIPSEQASNIFVGCDDDLWMICCQTHDIHLIKDDILKMKLRAFAAPSASRSPVRYLIDSSWCNLISSGTGTHAILLKHMRAWTCLRGVDRSRKIEMTDTWSEDVEQNGERSLRALMKFMFAQFSPDPGSRNELINFCDGFDSKHMRPWFMT